MSGEGEAAPEVCPVHGLVGFPRELAELKARRLRQEYAAGTPQSRALIQMCRVSEGEVWHVVVPSNAVMRVVRRRMRARGLLPRPSER